MTARDRIVIMIVLAVGAVAASWLLVISPKRQEAANLSTQIATQQGLLDAARSQMAAGQAARRRSLRRTQAICIREKSPGPPLPPCRVAFRP